MSFNVADQLAYAASFSDAELIHELNCVERNWAQIAPQTKRNIEQASNYYNGLEELAIKRGLL